MTETNQTKESNMADSLPASASKGANNGKYIYCDRFGFRRKYFVCLHTIDAAARGEGKEQTQTADCGNAVKCGGCVAKKMHQEEIEAGKALYFEEDQYKPGNAVERPRVDPKVRPTVSWRAPTHFSATDSKSPETYRTSVPKTTAPKPKEPSIDDGFVQALNAAAKEELSEVTERVEKIKEEAMPTQKPVTTATQKQVSTKRLPGESLVEMGKRLLRERQQ